MTAPWFVSGFYGRAGIRILFRRNREPIFLNTVTAFAVLPPRNHLFHFYVRCFISFFSQFGPTSGCLPSFIELSFEWIPFPFNWKRFCLFDFLDYLCRSSHNVFFHFFLWFLAWLRFFFVASCFTGRRLPNFIYVFKFISLPRPTTNSTRSFSTTSVKLTSRVQNYLLGSKKNSKALRMAIFPRASFADALLNETAPKRSLSMKMNHST